MTRPPVGSYTPSFGFPVSDWFRWFAWRPVDTVDRGWRWLRPIWRRRIAKHEYLSGGADFWWQNAVTVQNPASGAASDRYAQLTESDNPQGERE